ncbi:hypothetical protein BGW80DRAFT_1508618 [Lactifluus volemus]|nr:hypothetical protein BGW80DRAFT_1508618 [Lactifluus volemus]
MHRYVNLRSSWRTMAPHLPVAVDGNQSGRFLGCALAPSIQATLHRLWGEPAGLFFGRAGGVLGAFFVSGIMHDFAVWGAGLGTELSSVTFFFLMMGVGCVLEGLWRAQTGSKVQGPWGWLWAMAWMFFGAAGLWIRGQEEGLLSAKCQRTGHAQLCIGSRLRRDGWNCMVNRCSEGRTFYP